MKTIIDMISSWIAATFLWAESTAGKICILFIVLALAAFWSPGHLAALAGSGLLFGIGMALSADRITAVKNPGLQSYPVKATTKIYGGSIVAIDSTGFAIPAADAASLVVVGLCQNQADNSAGQDGDIRVRVEGPIRARLKATSITQAMVGLPMYVVDDETFDDAVGNNGVFAGILDEYISATEGWILLASNFTPPLGAVTASAAELNVLDGVVAGTVTANKGVVVGANKQIDTIVLAVSGLKIGAGAGTAMDATAAELNRNAGVTPGAALASKTVVLDANAGVGGVRRIINLAAASAVLDATQSGEKFVGLVDAVFTLPAAAAGTEGVWYEFETGALSAGVGLSLSPNAADHIRGNGLTSVDNKDLINTGATDRLGDSVRIYCDGVDGWVIEEIIGTWAKEA